MDLNSLFKKKDGDSGPAQPFQKDPRKAEKFFKHAEATGDSRQYDYSIDCYINGLRFDPDNLTRHEELREVAKRRKVGAGKPATLKEKLRKPGKLPIDKMLHAEMIWSKDTLNALNAIKVMEHAVEAKEQEKDLNLEEFAYWVGEIALELSQTTKKPDKNDFVKLCDLYARISVYNKAAEACRIAIALDPQNDNLLRHLKDLEAEQMLQEGTYTGKEGDFTKGIKDADLQQDLADQDAITKTESVVESNIARRREEYEEDPQDMDRLAKLAAVLLDGKEQTTENEAIELLEGAFERTGQYRYKVQASDVRMRQLRRQLSDEERKLKESPDDPEARKRYRQMRAERDKFELEEYIDRAKNYPTDMRVHFELGVRRFLNKQIDEAIGEFQQSRADPKHRAVSYAYLARCYVQLELLDEAIDALNTGIETHPVPDDKLGMELRYLLMDALEKSADQSRSAETALEAQKIASQILQTDIKYRDIRDRMKKIKDLAVKLQKG